MGNTNGREVLIADGPEIGVASGMVDDSIVINQGTSARPQPQLLFHTVHGVNVRTMKGGRMAKRVESFCKGLAFSNRPIAIDENVCLRFSEIATNWSGVLRFGVTNTDPATLREDLPKFACPDLTSKEGNWAKALAERYCVQGSILHFYVRENGDLYYGINGVLKGLFLSGINTNLPLWVMVDIYGNTSALEFVDPSEVRIKPSRHTRPAATTSSSSAPTLTPIPAPVASRHSTSSTTPIRELHEEVQPTPPLTPAMAALSLSNVVRPQISPNALCPVRYHAGVDFDRLALHTIRGKNMLISSDYTVAERTETEYAGGYIFSSRPIGLNEKVVVQVLSILPVYQGGLAFGLTSCDPIHLRPETLPDDSDDLLERHEYWVGIKDVAAMPKATDELAFWISDEGQVNFYRNNGTPRVIMHVDHTQRLWLWFDVYGCTQKVRILGSTSVSSRAPTLRPSTSGASSTMRRQIASLPVIAEQRRSGSTLSDRPSSSTASTPAPTTTAPTLRVNLPPPLVPARISPSRNDPANRRHSQPSSPPSRPPPPPPPKPSQPSQTSSYVRPPVTPVRPSSSSDPKDQDGGDECSICMSAGVDCVIYTCGHMCMCYDCACEQWQRKGDCPICRKNINDVIRIYKS